MYIQPLWFQGGPVPMQYGIYLFHKSSFMNDTYIVRKNETIMIRKMVYIRQA